MKPYSRTVEAIVCKTGKRQCLFYTRATTSDQLLQPDITDIYRVFCTKSRKYKNKVMPDITLKGKDSHDCTKSYYLIGYSIRVQSPKVDDMK